MNTPFIYFLKVLRKMRSKYLFSDKPMSLIGVGQNPDSASRAIFEELTSNKPSMIARFGNNELKCVCNYLGVTKPKYNYLGYIMDRSLPWWWEPGNIRQMNTNAGFFPPDIDKIEQFCELMLQDIPQVNLLGSWLSEEMYVDNLLNGVQKVNIELLNPYFSSTPWTKAMEDKKILVVHPFSETIKQQYKRRHLIFENNLLPSFELKTIKAVQTIAGTTSEFADWFKALDYMKEEIDQTDYDICLIGAGAYGFPLAAHVKRRGKKGFHMGGSLQLLFGIKGRRWEDPNYNKVYNYANLMNQYWVKPSEEETPKKAKTIEDECYW